MERTRPGRDFALSVRMGVALMFVAAMYLLALLLSFAVLVSLIADRAWGALLGWFFFAACLVIVAVMHWLHGDDLVLGPRVRSDSSATSSRSSARSSTASPRPPTCLHRT